MGREHDQLNSQGTDGQQRSSGSAPVPLEVVRYDTQTGLVPVVVQDARTKQVLMQAYANREALKRTLGTGQAWFWSRSRQEYWHKGATSGNVMDVVQVHVDCDGDSVLYLVEPHGPACHTGETSCYYRAVEHHPPGGVTESPEGHGADDGVALLSSTESGGAESEATGRKAQPSEGAEQSTVSLDSEIDESGSSHGTRVDASILSDLWETLVRRYRDRPQGSYTTFLFEHGVDKIAKKVGEEAVEVAIAAKNAVSTDPTEKLDKNPGQAELASESADLLYHLFALWKSSGIHPDDVFQVLRERHK